MFGYALGAHSDKSEIEIFLTPVRWTASEWTGGEMESQILSALIAQRDQIRQAISLLEARPPSRRELAAKHLIERLRLRAEWLDKRIQMASTRADNAA